MSNMWTFVSIVVTDVVNFSRAHPPKAIEKSPEGNFKTSGGQKSESGIRIIDIENDNIIIL